MGLKWGFGYAFGAGGGGCVSGDVLADVGSRNALIVRDQGLLALEVCGAVLEFWPYNRRYSVREMGNGLHSAIASASCCCR